MIDRFVQFVIRKYKYLLLRCSCNCYKNKDIVFMMPIEPPMNRLSEDFKELLESFKEDNK